MPCRRAWATCSGGEPHAQSAVERAVCVAPYDPVAALGNTVVTRSSLGSQTATSERYTIRLQEGTVAIQAHRVHVLRHHDVIGADTQWSDIVFLQHEKGRRDGGDQNQEWDSYSQQGKLAR